jgi:translation initiation factor eIF-2B subunit gamma
VVSFTRNPVLSQSEKLQKLALNHSSTLSRFDRDTKDDESSHDDEEESPELDADAFTTFRVGLIVHTASAGFAIRLNTLPNYLEMNRRVSPHFSLLDTG